MSTRRRRRVLRRRALRGRAHDRDNRTGEDKNIYKRGHATTFETGKHNKALVVKGDAL